MLWNKILLIYDSSESSLRAVEYAAKMFGKTEGVQVMIFGVFEKIPRHDLKDTSPIVEKLQRQISAMEREIERGLMRIKESKALLAKAGLDENHITIKYVERKQSAAKDILAEAAQGGYGTILIGRSDKQGFLAENVAKDLVSQAKEQAVCVV